MATKIECDDCGKEIRGGKGESVRARDHQYLLTEKKIAVMITFSGKHGGYMDICETCSAALVRKLAEVLSAPPATPATEVVGG